MPSVILYVVDENLELRTAALDSHWDLKGFGLQNVCSGWNWELSSSSNKKWVHVVVRYPDVWDTYTHTQTQTGCTKVNSLEVSSLTDIPCGLFI